MSVFRYSDEKAEEFGSSYTADDGDKKEDNTEEKKGTGDSVTDKRVPSSGLSAQTPSTQSTTLS